MLGGYQILDLRGIDLEVGTVATDITDANVLNQLLKLRDYIDKAYNFSKPLENQLKPVLIRFRDKKANEKIEGATYGELSVVNNYYSFKVTGRISGQFTLTINVTFEEVTNAYGNKEWVIDNATILLADASNVLEGNIEIEGDVAIDGDLSASGDLEVTGDIEGDSISGNEIVEKMEGYSFLPISSENWENDFIYVGVVKNGNKLTLVVFAEVTKKASTSYNELGTFTVPSAVASKLYPITIGVVPVLDIKNGCIFTDPQHVNDQPYSIYKESGNNLRFVLENTGDLVIDEPSYIRLEATFLLSDNLISQE